MSVRGDIRFRLHQYRFAMSVYSGTYSPDTTGLI